MSSAFGRLVVGLVSTTWLIAGSASAQQLSSESEAATTVESKQQPLELPIRVVDQQGAPIANAKISSWALRSSQGHGWWRKGDRAGLDPEDVFTDEHGLAAVIYPKFSNLAEGVHTTGVTLLVDHPEYACVAAVHIDLPLEADGPYLIKLQVGVPLDVRPTIDGAATSLDNLFVLWSDARSYQPGVAPKHLPEGVLQIPAMPPGKNSVFLVKLDGDRATHFSKITDVELVAGESKRIDIPLRPSMRITGKLSDNVPRPVRAGRLKTATLDPTGTVDMRVSWFSWVPIEPDGTFTIDGWPADEPLQLIALCEGFLAASGQAPNCVKNPIDPAKDSFHRPQVFAPEPDRPIEVTMTPMGHCAIKVIDEGDRPLPDVVVTSWPNVCWWNSGSQIYCHPLVRGETVLRKRSYMDSLDEALGTPFRVETDAAGQATIELPVGNEALVVSDEVYELPIFLGRRDVKVKLTQGEVAEVVLRVQPKGTEQLGEWDKLAGVVFGCSTREGRRICALPAVQKKMDQFVERFREGKNRKDPKLLSEAYAFVADAFVSAGDAAEAAKWRKKAEQQAQKALAQ